MDNVRAYFSSPVLGRTARHRPHRRGPCRHLKLLLAALCKLPPQPATVYRGARGDLAALYAPGSEVVWRGPGRPRGHRIALSLLIAADWVSGELKVEQLKGTYSQIIVWFGETKNEALCNDFFLTKFLFLGQTNEPPTENHSPLFQFFVSVLVERTHLAFV